MTDYIADDFESIAQRLRELEVDRNPPQAIVVKVSKQRWACHHCNKYKHDHEVTQRSGYKTKCLDCGGYVKKEE